MSNKSICDAINHNNSKKHEKYWKIEEWEFKREQKNRPEQETRMEFLPLVFFVIFLTGPCIAQSGNKTAKNDVLAEGQDSLFRINELRILQFYSI